MWEVLVVSGMGEGVGGVLDVMHAGGVGEVELGCVHDGS